jgi:aldehyde:ferredoxin oxidoreductase
MSISGYNGKILRVNLTTNTLSEEAIDADFCRRYIGGAGFATYYLWKELKPEIDALSPDNKLIFAVGPLTGLSLLGTARNCVCAKSPLGGSIAKSESGGYWGVEMKRAGYDVLIIEGKSETPVYLWVQNGKGNIKNASHLWGKNTKETEAVIREELGDDHVQVASIGPGGENMVRYACIMHGCHDAAGRGGLGAVMGSKNLKAVAVRGHKSFDLINPEKVKEIRRQKMPGKDNAFSLWGTGGPEMISGEQSGNLPIRNFREGVFPEVSQITGVVIKDNFRIGMEGCFACPVRCKKVVKFEEPYPVDPIYGGPEYETLAALGSDCGISNLKAIIKANELCNAYSLDTISTGGTIAFAMECFEKGIIDKGQTGGIELRFGNEEAMLQAIELIARRQGIGKLLAEGSARMAKEVGKASLDFAMQVKGVEAGLHDPRLRPTLGLGYMVNPNGADHCSSMADAGFNTEYGIQPLHPLGIWQVLPTYDVSSRKVAIFIVGQLKSILEDSLLLCGLCHYELEQEAELVTAVTGWDTSIAELLKVAQRIVTTSRLLNIKQGLTKADDILPTRYFQPKANGALTNTYLDRNVMEKAKESYYILMGWDRNGIPLPEKVEELYIE